MSMPDFPIDPELRIRTSPPVVLRRTTEAVGFIRKMALSRPGHGWRDLLQSLGDPRQSRRTRHDCAAAAAAECKIRRHDRAGSCVASSDAVQTLYLLAL